MSWRIEYKGIVNSMIIENTDDARRFIEQMDEQLPVEILVTDFSKILNSLFSCISQLRNSSKFLKLFCPQPLWVINTTPVDNFIFTNISQRKPSIVARKNAIRNWILPRHAKIARRVHAPETTIKMVRRMGCIG